MKRKFNGKKLKKVYKASKSGLKRLGKASKTGIKKTYKGTKAFGKFVAREAKTYKGIPRKTKLAKKIRKKRERIGRMSEAFNKRMLG